MSNLKIFVSSTCYDMHTIRAQLRTLLTGLGYEPVLSDQADVLYDPRSHTHTSCVREIEYCDMVVVVIGSRFGGATIPKALELIDLTRLTDWSRAENFAEDKGKISVTQAEVLRAIQTGIPVFAFVDSGVMRDHLTYEKNKAKSIISQIDFSSIEKRETAPYIFEFINFLRLRNENNSIFEFSRFEDIEIQIKKQWAGLFQRLLHEQRERAIETRRIDNLSSQIADLKAAVLGSISSNELKETAKGAIRYRLMIDFLSSAASAATPFVDTWTLLVSQMSWEEIFTTFGITEIRAEARSRPIGLHSVMLRVDGTYYRVRLSIAGIARLGREWSDFKELGKDAKEAIANAVIDSRQGRLSFLVRFYNEPYVEDTNSSQDEDIEMDGPGSQGVSDSRILLTQEKFIEESIKNHLSAAPSFKGMKFLVDVQGKSVVIVVLPSNLNGSSSQFTYEYDSNPDGKLTEVLGKLTSSIDTDLERLKVQRKDLQANKSI